mmetsp:Transcript_23081/g.60983  ORF Transcript_23081/g.60983 Transcript_23081/m.60983 type:complete len:296 (+) Transcript_23081:1389-2276(+)
MLQAPLRFGLRLVPVSRLVCGQALQVRRAYRRRARPAGEQVGAIPCHERALRRRLADVKHVFACWVNARTPPPARTEVPVLVEHLMFSGAAGAQLQAAHAEAAEGRVGSPELRGRVLEADLDVGEVDQHPVAQDLVDNLSDPLRDVIHEPPALPSSVALAFVLLLLGLYEALQAASGELDQLALTAQHLVVGPWRGRRLLMVPGADDQDHILHDELELVFLAIVLALLAVSKVLVNPPAAELRQIDVHVQQVNDAAHHRQREVDAVEHAGAHLCLLQVKGTLGGLDQDVLEWHQQ